MVWFSERKLLNINCVFWFSHQLLSETFLILRRINRDIVHVRRSSCKLTRSPDEILTKIIFEKYSNIKFHGTPSTGATSCSMRTDRQTWNLKVAFGSFANAPLISCLPWILGKNVTCNYIVSLILHKYVERCVSLCIVGVARHVSGQGPAVWVYKRRTKSFTLCIVILQCPRATLANRWRY